MFLKAPLYAQIEVTYSCNLMCSYCLNDSRHEVSNNRPQLAFVKKEDLNVSHFRDIAQKVVDWDVFTATITGGEPLKVCDRVFAVLETLVENNVYTDMNTNLAILEEGTVKELLFRGLKGILTSIVSYNPEVHDSRVNQNGALKKTVRGIQIIKSIDSEFSICANMVLSKENAKDVYETGMFLKKIGVDSMTVCPLTPSRTGVELQLPSVLNEQEMLKALYDLVRLNEETGILVRILQGLPHCFLMQDSKFERFLTVGCDAGSSYVTINPYGDVMPCAQIPDKYGNILKDDLSIVWKNLQTKNFLPDECKMCDAKEYCSGGCRAEAERRTQTDLKAKHPFMKEPVEKKQKKFDVEKYICRTFRAVKDIAFREEGNGFYVVRGPKKDYAFLSEPEMDILRSLQTESLMVTEKLIENEVFSNFLGQALKSRILVEVA